MSVLRFVFAMAIAMTAVLAICSSEVAAVTAPGALPSPAGPSPAAVLSPAPSAVVPAGTPLVFHVDEPLSSGTSKTNQPFTFTLVKPIMVGGNVVVPAGAAGSGTLLLAGHAGSGGHEGDLTLQLDSVTTPGGDVLALRGQRIELNGRNRKVAAGLLGFVPYAGFGARFIRGQESVVSTSMEIRTVLAADATLSPPAVAKP